MGGSAEEEESLAMYALAKFNCRPFRRKYRVRLRKWVERLPIAECTGYLANC